MTIDSKFKAKGKTMIKLDDIKNIEAVGLEGASAVLVQRGLPLKMFRPEGMEALNCRKHDPTGMFDDIFIGSLGPVSSGILMSETQAEFLLVQLANQLGKKVVEP